MSKEFSHHLMAPSLWATFFLFLDTEFFLGIVLLLVENSESFHSVVEWTYFFCKTVL